MRVNIYAEEMTDLVEIIGKEIDGHTFTGLRFYLHLPVTDPTGKLTVCPACKGWKYKKVRAGETDHSALCLECEGTGAVSLQLQGPFVHRPGDDDSSAVTFWGKRDLREVLRKALSMLDAHYEQSTP